MKHYSLLSIALVQSALVVNTAANANAVAATAPDDAQLQLRRNLATARRGLDWTTGIWDMLTGGGGGGDNDWEDILENIDLQNMDWDQMVSLMDDIDWQNIDWNNGELAWEEWLDTLSTALPEDLDVCSVVEMGIGMSMEFAEEANCECVGDLATGLEIDCSFKACAYAGTDDETCGVMDMSFNFDSTSGEIDVSACADMDDDDFEKICFGYRMDVTNGSDITPAAPTCEASYGDLTCDCSMNESFCMSLDCSSILPGAVTDTCQVLSMHNDNNGGASGTNAFIPEFAVFREAGNDEDEDEENVFDGDIEFKLSGKTRTCEWVEKKLAKIVKAGKNVKKKTKKFCKKQVKVNDNKVALGTVCDEVCGTVMN